MLLRKVNSNAHPWTCQLINVQGRYYLDLCISNQLRILNGNKMVIVKEGTHFIQAEDALQWILLSCQLDMQCRITIFVLQLR